MPATTKGTDVVSVRGRTANTSKLMGRFWNNLHHSAICVARSCGSSRGGRGSMFYPHQQWGCILLKVIWVIHCSKALYSSVMVLDSSKLYPSTITKTATNQPNYLLPKILTRKSYLNLTQKHWVSWSKNTWSKTILRKFSCNKTTAESASGDLSFSVGCSCPWQPSRSYDRVRQILVTQTAAFKAQDYRWDSSKTFNF